MIMLNEYIKQLINHIRVLLILLVFVLAIFKLPLFKFEYRGRSVRQLARLLLVLGKPNSFGEIELGCPFG